MSRKKIEQIGNPRISLTVIQGAKSGDIQSVMAILKSYDPYIRKLSTVCFGGTSYLNTDLYDRLKTKLIISIPKFQM